MLLFWACTVSLVTIVTPHKIVDSTEDVPPTGNTTTLFPVNNTVTSNTSTIKSATSWKIETTFGESKLDSNSTDSKEELVVEQPGNSSKEFKPSPLLSTYVEDHSFRFEPTKETPGAFSPVIKKPPTGFISSPKEAFRSSFNKLPKESFKSYHEFPYKFEPAIFTRAKDGWKPTGTPGAGQSDLGHTGILDSRPTDEAPVRVPAGGLYKLPDPFKIKPGTTDDDFGLEFSGDVKENAVKKRANPWKGLLHLLTALIPVGIIFSALTPSVITIEPEQSLGPNIVRRGDGGFAPVPPISERCRRRLLCELHSESNYYRSPEPRRGKPCHRLRCEDPAALATSLRWLLAHRPPPSPPHT